jgi:hypothetical protein
MMNASGSNRRKKLGWRKDVDSWEGRRVQGGDIDNLGCNKLACKDELELCTLKCVVCLCVTLH